MLEDIQKQYHDTISAALDENCTKERIWLIMDGYAQAYFEQMTIDEAIQKFEQTPFQWVRYENHVKKAKEIALEAAIKIHTSPAASAYDKPSTVVDTAEIVYQWLIKKEE